MYSGKDNAQMPPNSKEVANLILYCGIKVNNINKIIINIKVPLYNLL
jgi:hypothetical protein